MPERPRIEITVPPEPVTLGGTLRVTARCTLTRGTDVKRILLRVEGAQWIRCAHCGALQAREKKPELQLEATVHEAGTLTAGPHELEASFVLPTDAMPSYVATHSYFEWTARCLVDIPWWPDAKGALRLWIPPPRRERPPPEPTVLATVRTARAPYIEATLEDGVYSPGDVIRGRMAISDLRGAAVEELTYALHKEEIAGPHRLDPYKRTRRHDAYTERRWVPPADVAEGASIPIELVVPPIASPSLGGQLSVWIRYAVSIALRTSDAEQELSLPVELRWLGGEHAAGGDVPVGDARWREVWRAAADAVGLALEPLPEQLGLAGRIGEADVEIRPTTEERGLALSLRWTSRWGLGLELAPRRLRRPFEDDPFAAHYRLEGRERAQLDAVFTPSLRAAIAELEDVHADDDGLRAWHAIGSFELTDLVPVLRTLRILIEAASEARASTPPPAELAASLDAWRGFAARSDAALIVGAMALDLPGDDPVSVTTRFDERGHAVGARIEVCFHPPLASASPTGEVATRVAALRAAGELTLDPMGLRLDLPEVLRDPATASASIEATRSIAHALRVGVDEGPYR
ncbi:MAG: hypothetical protein H6719_20585 [Sandaracinaceae bacterium]|nr:hypothetical protein [Sandaracinaceae bacterium]